MKYNIVVEVDEEKLKTVAELDNVYDAIKQEAGWMNESGIYVETISKVKQNTI